MTPRPGAGRHAKAAGSSWSGQAKPWALTLAALGLSLASTAALVTYVPGKQTPLAAAQTPAPVCSKLGIAGSADWERASLDQGRLIASTIRSLGSERVRLGVLWNRIETTPGVYDWRETDTHVRLALEAGLKPTLMLYTAPSWVNTSFAGPNFAQMVDTPPPPIDGVALAPSLRSGAPAAPAESRLPASAGGADRAPDVAFGHFAAALAQRYAGLVEGYEIWNEPNTARFWDPPNVEFYARALRRAYTGIHAVEPGATVVTAGMAPAPDAPGSSLAPETFIRELYRLGANRYADAIGLHPYIYRDPQSQWGAFRDYAAVRNLMVSAGDGAKKVWITEYGAPSGGFGGVSGAQQAQIIGDAIDRAVADPNIGPIFIYTLQDMPLGATNAESHFGLYTLDARAKPAVQAVRDAATRCAGRG